MKRYLICLLILFTGTSLFAQSSAKIEWGYFQQGSYIQGELVYFNVKVKNTGTTVLSGLWLNVDISDPNGINVRQGWWQDIPTLSPNQTYETGYDFVWLIPLTATLGVYNAAVGLRDASTVYDIKYQIDNFIVIQRNPAAEIQSAYTNQSSYDPGETVKLNVKVKNIGNVSLSGLWLNVDIASPSGGNVVQGFWQDVPTLNPNETFETGYNNVWNIPFGAEAGSYNVTVGLRDNSTIYDIEYNIENFTVTTGNPNAEIVWGYIENNTYHEWEEVRFNVKVKNTGSAVLTGLWLNVDISDPNGINVRQGWWQDIPTLNPNDTYETEYDDLWNIPHGALTGVYNVAVGIRDNTNIYDIVYGIDQFNVQSLPPLPISTGAVLFHNYSDYLAWDGKLYMLNLSTGILNEISSNWNIDHTINAHFSPDGSKIVFMGVPEGSHQGNSWDIYLWQIGQNNPINLTNSNGLRDEDPKFSPNGNAIVFKQNGDLKVMDLNGNIINVVTNTPTVEESMPFYTSDGQKIIYARGAGNNSDIYIINTNGSNNQPLQNITNLQEYYPITRDQQDYLFTRWVSPTNQHDQIYLGYFSGANPQALSFNSQNSDFSDPYPAGSNYVFYSSTRSGGSGGYDLYLAELSSNTSWSMSMFNANTSRDELGACYSDIITHISESNISVADYELKQNYPNPFNSSTKISYSLPKSAFTTLKLYDVLGREIYTFVEKFKSIGSYTVDFDASNLPSGIYLYKIQTSDFTATKKMLLIE